jgi:hypothetical protein
MTLKTKVCNKCGKEKALTEFYIRQNIGDGFFNWCKDCHKAISYGNTNHSKDRVIEIGAASVITKLLSLGVYAAPDKASVFKHVDVVAWGCVRAEFPLFFYNGRLRKSIVYTPSKSREYHSVIRKSLSNELRAEYKDAWYLVERKRQEISERLQQGFQI